MFDIGWSEIILVVVVALIVIGPKDMPKALYEAGRWLRQIRMLAGEFHRGLGEVMREAEVEELRRKAREAAQEAERMGTLPASVQELLEASRIAQAAYDPASLDISGPAVAASAVPAAPVPAETLAAESPPAEETSLSAASSTAPAPTPPPAEATPS